MKVFLKILMWVAIIAAVIFLTLFIAMKVGQFENFRALLDYVSGNVQESFN